MFVLLLSFLAYFIPESNFKLTWPILYYYTYTKTFDSMKYYWVKLPFPKFFFRKYEKNLALEGSCANKYFVI